MNIAKLQSYDTSPYQYPPDYEPNFKDPRVIKKCTKAIAFAIASVPVIKSRQLSKGTISKYLGQAQTDLSKYLRNKLLICKNEFYSKDLKIAKEYSRNVNGVEYISCRVIGKPYVRAETPPELDFDADLDEPKYTRSVDPEVYSFGMKSALDLLREKHHVVLGDLVNGTVQYVRKSHRYYNGLQNTQKEPKKYLLASIGFQHQYDVEACAPTALYQYAQQLGMEEYMLAIGAYIEDRKTIREYIAKDTGVSISDVKLVVNALFSGARLGNNQEFCLYKHFKGNKKVIDLLNNNIIIRGLKRDISLMWAYIAANDPYISTHRTYKKNKNGVRCLVPLRSSEKWDLYFSLESRILDAAIEFTLSKEVKSFNEHDGWTLNKAIDLPELTEYIKTKTGFKLKIEYNYIEQFVEYDSLVQDVDSLDSAFSYAIQSVNRGSYHMCITSPDSNTDTDVESTGLHDKELFCKKIKDILAEDLEIKTRSCRDS